MRADPEVLRGGAVISGAKLLAFVFGSLLFWGGVLLVFYPRTWLDHLNRDLPKSARLVLPTMLMRVGGLMPLFTGLLVCSGTVLAVVQGR
jgi:hypothetical protein